MLVEVTETGALPAAKGVVRHRNWDRHVDADHPDLNAGHEVAGGVAVAREDGNAVAVLVLRRQGQRLLVGVGADDAQHRAEDLVGVDRHVGRHVVEQRRADEVTAFQAGVAEGEVVAGAFPAVDALIGAGYGSAGERCMAISVAVPVGEETANRLRARLVERVNQLRVGHSLDPKADYGPLVTAAALARVKDYIGQGVEAGAEIVVDGRDRASDDLTFGDASLEGGYFIVGMTNSAPSFTPDGQRDVTVLVLV